MRKYFIPDRKRLVKFVQFAWKGNNKLPCFSLRGLCYTSPTTCFALFAGMAASRASKFCQNAALKVDEPLLWILLTFGALRKRMNLLIESAIVKWEPITMNQETLVIFHGFTRMLPPVLRVIQHRALLYKDGALIEEPKGKLENRASYCYFIRKRIASCCSHVS